MDINLFQSYLAIAGKALVQLFTNSWLNLLTAFNATNGANSLAGLKSANGILLV
jgi:hypothetical protein